MPVGTFLSAHRSASYALFSTTLVGLVILNAFQKHSNFYAVSVYLSRSSGSVMALANFGILLTMLFGNLCRVIFFGPLRPVETERLYDRMWFFVTESLLAFTIFRDDFDTPFVLMFMVLLFLKCFHWILADRIDWMDQVPYPGPGKTFHLRTWSLLCTLYVCDLLLFLVSLDMLVSQGIGWVVLFASEFAILLATILNAWLKYGIACYDLFRARSRGGENAPVWEDKSMWTFYVELVTDFLKLLTYLAFFTFVMTNYGLPLNVVRDVYITARSFVSRVRDLIRYRSATKNMDKKYPDATRAELDAMSDRTCIICREEMTLPEPTPTIAEGAPPPPTTQQTDGPNETPKKLPCGHIFHFHCLRSWLERQQSCPTCRRSVLEANPAPATPAQPAPPAPGARPVPPPGQAGQPNGPGNNAADAQARLLNQLLGRAPAGGDNANVNGNPNPAVPAPTPAPTANGHAGAPNPTPQGVRPAPQPPAPRVFQGFNAGGQWHPWGYGQPERTPTPTPTTKEPSSSSVPSTDTTLEAPSTSDPSTSEASENPLTAREAAAAAALKRFGGAPAPSTSSAIKPSPPSEPVARVAPPTPRSRPSAPSLIPLFDPSAISTQIARSLPMPYATTPYAGFPFISAVPMNIPSPRGPPTPSSLPLPSTITDEQLSRLEHLTREGIEERLKILETVQGSLWKCVEDLTRVSSVLPETGGATMIDDKGKGKEKENDGFSGSS